MKKPKYHLYRSVLALGFVLFACVSEPLEDSDCDDGANCDDATGGKQSGGTGGKTGGTGGAAGTSGASGTGGTTPGGQCGGIEALDQACSPRPQSDPCVQCIFEKCCDSVDATQAGGPTTDLADCWYDCTTPQCEADCYDMYPDGVVGFGEYDACTMVNCFSQDFCPVQSCTKCQATLCECEYAACMVDYDCNLIYQCINACSGDPAACQERCTSEHPGGADKIEILTVCVAQNCIDDC